MGHLSDSPFGFEDGQILRYEADAESLVVFVEFWNEVHGLIRFEGYLMVRDNGAVGVSLGGVRENRSSELINTAVAHNFVKSDEDVQLTHYQFLDVDNDPIFDVVAESCAFLDLEKGKR